MGSFLGKRNKPRMKLGITGGIGSGKTSVCRVFGTFGIPVFSADPQAREIMESDKSVIRQLNIITGKNIYHDGSLDRKELASIIFNDRDILHKVNSLVHPLVFKRFVEWVEEQTTPYIIMEAAILFESKASLLVDKVATVVAPVEERVERVIHRNNFSREQVLERMRAQMSDEEKMKRSDYVIMNSEDDMIIPAILAIHNELMSILNSGI